MRAFVRFVRKRGWAQAATLFVGIAAIIGGLIGAALGNPGVSLLVLIALCLVGAALIVLALVCLVIGPGGERSGAAETVAELGLEVPPDTPVRLPEGVPRDTTVRISASEDLEKDDESAEDEPRDP